MKPLESPVSASQVETRPIMDTAPAARGGETERPRLWTAALVGCVVLAIVTGVVVTLAQHSFVTATPPAAPAEPSRPARGPGGKERSLETMGSLTAIHLYQTYLNLGLLADARESDVYTPAEAEKLLESVTQMLETGDRQLAKLQEEGLEEQDKEAVENARQLAGLLRTQARELRAYWRSGKKEHADRFQKARQQSLSDIQKILGIEE